MESLRAIRRKIGVVKNIQKITQAMKMVAAAKLRKVQGRVAASRPYAEKMRELIDTVAPQVRDLRHPLLEVRKGNRLGLVVLTSDRGLCGSYNHNVIRQAVSFWESQPKEREMEILCVGRKGRDYFLRRGYNVVEHFHQITEDSPFSEVRIVTQAIVGLYTREEKPVDAVYIAYTRFISALQQRPQVVQFLPLAPPRPEEEEVVGNGYRPFPVEYIFEPEPEQLLSVLLPKFVNNQVYQYLLESLASEYGARMTAMSNATDNAAELLETLTLQYNKARQASITKEILEIATGAEALRQG
ncbi:MAG TPA: ATP synthase F1 subunit gamma [Armatimonadetes bacterium]|nr:ATP synthase F1 subunit gamma [Armatimonadota bacterium]